MYTLKILAPFFAGLCFDNFVTKQGELCNFRDQKVPMVKYNKPNPEVACYRDGIFYTRCKDLENS